MRRFVNLSLLCLAAGAGACSTPELSVPTEVLPYAGVRFINAVPDSAGAFGMDFRFVDILESNAHFRIAFRNNPGANSISSQIQYKGAREGTRHFRVFLDDSVMSIATTVLKDTSVALTKGRNYTAMMWGNGRSTGGAAGTPGGQAMALAFWEEAVTAPAVGKISVRAINTTNAAVDVWAFTGTTAPATATWAALAPYTASTYQEVDSGTYRYQVRAAGSATNLFANTIALAGVVPICSGRPTAEYTAANPSGCPTGQPADIEAVPGTKVAGTAITGIIFPRSTAGARTPQAAAFTVPAITYMWDRRPPRTCDPYC